MYHLFRTCSIDAHDRAAIEHQYGEGFLFTRLGNTVMHQVRSVRVPLYHFQPSSENRRVLRKHPTLSLYHFTRAKFVYHWNVGKMAKEFYNQFGEKTFSANKIKELICAHDSPMNAMLEYREGVENSCGYCLIFETPSLVHYAYPFYRLTDEASIGMAMMTRAVVWAKEQGKKYIYLGSIQNEKSLYKFQFKGVEWFDGNRWRQDKPKF